MSYWKIYGETSTKSTLKIGPHIGHPNCVHYRKWMASPKCLVTSMLAGNLAMITACISIAGFPPQQDWHHQRPAGQVPASYGPQPTPPRWLTNLKPWKLPTHFFQNIYACVNSWCLQWTILKLNIALLYNIPNVKKGSMSMLFPAPAAKTYHNIT